MVTVEGDPAIYKIIFKNEQRESAILASYDEENVVMRMAFEWLLQPREVLVICTKRQSLL